MFLNALDYPRLELPLANTRGCNRGTHYMWASHRVGFTEGLAIGPEHVGCHLRGEVSPEPALNLGEAAIQNDPNISSLLLFTSKWLYDPNPNHSNLLLFTLKYIEMAIAWPLRAFPS